MSDTNNNPSETENKTPLRPGEYCIVHETRSERERRAREEEEKRNNNNTANNNDDDDDDDEEAREQEQEERDKGFECAICLEIATEPVVTQCGHLFW